MEENWTGNSQPRSQWFLRQTFHTHEKAVFVSTSIVSPFFLTVQMQAEFSEKNHSKKGQSAPFYQKEVSVLAPESLQHNIIVRFPLWWFAKTLKQTLSRVASGKSTFA